MTAIADRHLLFGSARAAERHHQPGPACGRLPGLDARQVQEPGRPPGSPRRPDRRQAALLEALAEVHLEAHAATWRRASPRFRPASRRGRAWRGIGDPDIERTLGHVGSGHGSTEDGDADRTATYAVGTATSDGQRFRVLRPHARGGLGAVFVALDVELNREVALKQILDHHADDPTSRQRFLIEAEITGGLEHPGIVPVYGLGTYGDGRPYYAMRFIRGDSLKEAIDRFHADGRSLRGEGRRRVARPPRDAGTPQAAAAVHRRLQRHRLRPQPRRAAPRHQAGQHHRRQARRDAGGRLGPGQGHRQGRAGRARSGRSCPRSASGSAETLPGSALGTPAYMSPEQARGDLDRLGPRSDVYSLGATLYCLLTGKPPLEGDDIGELLRKVQRGEFPPPRQLDPSIDQALEAVCLKAMALQPEDRYASCRMLAEDIERWMADEPVTAWVEPWTRTLLRWLTRHRTGVTGAAAAVAGRSGRAVGRARRADTSQRPVVQVAGSRNGRQRRPDPVQGCRARTVRSGCRGDQDLSHRRQRGLPAEGGEVQGAARRAPEVGLRLLRQARRPAWQ